MAPHLMMSSWVTNATIYVVFGLCVGLQVPYQPVYDMWRSQKKMSIVWQPPVAIKSATTIQR